jgi:hypothetical protein
MNMKPKSPEWSAVVSFIQSLNEVEQCELIFEAFQSSREDSERPDGDFEKSRMVIARSRFGRFRGKLDDGYWVQFIAEPTDDAIERENAHRIDSFIEAGMCPRCHAELGSWAKGVRCPLCDAAANLT